MSVGGLGGTGGDAGTVTLSSTGTISTAGALSKGLWAQSVGGGGGRGGFAIAGNLTFSGPGGASVAVGGHGGAGGNSAAVIVNSNVGTTPPALTATIHTTGADSEGIFAQSVGGGGGSGGFSGAVSVSATNANAALGVSVGGKGGAGGNASTVNVSSFDNILTEGKGSAGILAQSLGGGGGNGGFSFAGTFIGSIADGGTAAAISVAVGGSGNAAGNSSTVTVSSAGIIETNGEHADGVLAQSIGGGGGNWRHERLGLARPRQRLRADQRVRRWLRRRRRDRRQCEPDPYRQHADARRFLQRPRRAVDRRRRWQRRHGAVRDIWRRRRQEPQRHGRRLSAAPATPPAPRRSTTPARSPRWARTRMRSTRSRSAVAAATAGLPSTLSPASAAKDRTSISAPRSVAMAAAVASRVRCR